MNKIIQLLRLSRLVLLVILLLFAVAAKIARAELAQIFANDKSEYIYPSARAACEAIGGINPPGSDNYSGGICINPETGKYAGAFTAITKFCDAKELTHDGVSNGASAPQNYFWQKSYSGTDAALWFPDRYESCENNCVVRNQRMPIPIPPVVPEGVIYSQDGKSVTEKDGKSWSWFTKNQTGEVCVPEKPKKNDPPKPPAPDTDNGTGNGQSNPGSDSGSNNGSGSQGGQGSGSQNGSDGQANQGSGNSNEGGSNGGGSGSGSGGVNGSGGQTGPSGGGTSGGESGGNESSGSEGEAGGESDGSGEESGGSGDSGSQGGSDGSGQGNVGGEGNNGQNGQPGGTDEGQGNGEGDGQGSISGGSCELNQAPDCKGDPIQCYIAREQWRTACATLGNKGNISGGDCTSLTPPKCEGDATQCYIAKQQFMAACEAQAQREARDGLKGYADGKSGVISDVEGASEDGVNNALEANSGQFDMTNIFDLSGFGLTRGCPAPRVVDMGDFGQVEFDTGMFCTFAQILGNIFVGLTMLWALRYVFA